MNLNLNESFAFIARIIFKAPLLLVAIVCVMPFGVGAKCLKDPDHLPSFQAMTKACSKELAAALVLAGGAWYTPGAGGGIDGASLDFSKENAQGVPNVQHQTFDEEAEIFIKIMIYHIFIYSIINFNTWNAIFYFFFFFKI